MDFKDNGVLCLMPWVHLHVSTTGNAYPCCVSDYSQSVGNIRDDNIETLVNSPSMCSLRKNMLEGKKSSICNWCYENEKVADHSFRTTSIKNFGHYANELFQFTDDNGFLPNFKMKYLDIRFSNICNMKCRSCGSEFSSQWAQENKNLKLHFDEIIQKADKTDSLLNQVLQHADNIEEAYFAGGEPFITEEHYVILEELIRTGASKKIKLRYSTNMSNLIYKKYDLFDLWKNFGELQISASLDHYGERAEYIRTGTDWATVESNILRLQQVDNVEIQFNTVVSIFNYPTLGEFFEYLNQKNLKQHHHNVTVSNVSTPEWCNPQNLPKRIKEVATNKLSHTIDKFIESRDWSNQALISAYKYANKQHLWNINKEILQKNILRLDIIRNTNFVDVFPELSGLMDDISEENILHTEELKKWIKTAS